MVAAKYSIIWNRVVNGISRYVISLGCSGLSTTANPSSQKHFKQKSLIILRSCNELLRRLSRAEDTVFCGRVFIFLFQSFPLGDKSSVNLRGEFHTENVTSYDEISKPNGTNDDEDTKMAEDSEDPTPAAETPEGTNKEEDGAASEKSGSRVPKVVVSGGDKNNSEEPMDLDALYPIFWNLQSFFSAPTKTFDAERFASFKNGLEATLKAFKNIKADIENKAPSRSSDDAHKSHKRKRPSDEAEIGTSFNPKYLTSRDLFDLEVGDTAFRRHVLVQALILLDFMLSLTSTAKTRHTDLTNKSVLYGFTLSDDDAKWVANMRRSIEGYLQGGPGGKFYYRMVDTVLSRDRNWVRWKAEGCPPIERPAITVPDYMKARTEASRTYANKRLRPTPMGSLDLKFLSDAEALANIERLQESDRFAVPSADSFLMSIMDDEMDIDMAPTQDEKDAAIRSKSSKTWRILRLAAKSKLSAFDKINDGQNLKALFEIPQEAPAESVEPAEGHEGGETVDGAEGADGANGEDNETTAAVDTVEGTENAEQGAQDPVKDTEEMQEAPEAPEASKTPEAQEAQEIPTETDQIPEDPQELGGTSES